MTYDDQSVPISCSECNEVVEGVDNIIEHILRNHSEYNQVEAETAARNWAEDAYERIDLENIERAEEFRRTGYDSWDD